MDQSIPVTTPAWHKNKPQTSSEENPNYQVSTKLYNKLYIIITVIIIIIIIKGTMTIVGLQCIFDEITLLIIEATIFEI